MIWLDYPMPEDEKRPKRRTITMKIGYSGLDWLDGLAREHRVPRAEVIRASFAVAKKHEREVEQRIEGGM